MTLAKLYEDKYVVGGGAFHQNKLKQSFLSDISAATRKPAPLALSAPPIVANKFPPLPASTISTSKVPTPTQNF